ncbi:MAG: transposase [Alphaproteobacteria bacterium]|nr:transposase [Alphaproteobacteria bacterium]
MSLIDLFCNSFKNAPAHILLDIDDTTARVNGSQQLALFNAHWDDYCFKLLRIYDVASSEPVLALPRPRKLAFGLEAAGVLKHTVRRIKGN